jgi:hypothetical protein
MGLGSEEDRLCCYLGHVQLVCRRRRYSGNFAKPPPSRPITNSLRVAWLVDTCTTFLEANLTKERPLYRFVFSHRRPP